MNSILVTGGSGFIGSHTCLTLLENGYFVYVVDTFQNSSPKSLERVKQFLKSKNLDVSERIQIFQIDIRDENSLKNIFIEASNLGYPIQSVIHFAGLKAVAESVENPLLYWDNNVKGAITLLKVMEQNNCKTIVFSSSATIYGYAGDKNIDEATQISPINPYGSTKVVIEYLLNDIFNKNKKDWRIANLRYFNPIGAHPLGDFGEDNTLKTTNIFPNICKAAMGEISLFKINGKDWPTPDGTCIRDYIHIMDLANGHLAAMNFLKNSNPQFIPINLGTGKGTSILELINIFEETNKVKIPYIFDSRRPGDSHISYADNQFAINNLNWTPFYGVNDMCKHGWEFMRKNLRLNS